MGNPSLRLSEVLACFVTRTILETISIIYSHGHVLQMKGKNFSKRTTTGDRTLLNTETSLRAITNQPSQNYPNLL